MTKIKISNGVLKNMMQKYLTTVQYLSDNFLTMRTISSSLSRV